MKEKYLTPKLDIKPMQNIHIQHFKYPNDMDKGCIKICDIFNSCGLTTKYSCCGHGKTDFRVIFDDNVTTTQMKEFLSLFENQYTHSPFLGRFAMWMRKMNGNIVTNWMYEARHEIEAGRDALTLLKEITGSEKYFDT